MDLSVIRRLQEGLSKTRHSVLGNLRRVMSSRKKVDDETIEEFGDVLLAADVGPETTSILLNLLRERARKEQYESMSDLIAHLADIMTEVLAPRTEPAPALFLREVRPYVVMVVGINGVGKTTTVGKLAALFRAEGRSVTLGAADTFRAAANEQLEIWAKRAGVDIIRQHQGADPGAVTYDTMESAIARKSDVVLIDTAGRLHTKVNLMEELAKVRRVIDRRLPGAPHEVLLVMDAGTGQNGLQQIRRFSESAGVTGLVLTKLDGTAKGGIIFAAAREAGVPVRYIGVGEGIHDLQLFRPREFVSALLSESELSEKVST